MKLITRQSRARETAERWKKQYSSKQQDGQRAWTSQRHADVHAQLLTATTPEQCLEIIGNDWCRCDCDECDKEVNEVVELGDPPDYESNTVHLCFECAKKALLILEAAQPLNNRTY